MNQHAPSPVLEVHDLSVSYNQRPVLWNVDIALPGGQIIGLIGPNGAGKSTLLKACLGLVPINSGWTKFWNAPFTKQRHRVAYVPQRSVVDWDFPARVKDVVSMGTYGSLGLLQRFGKEHKARVTAALQQVELSELAKRPISQLSGGQKQRVFLARALAQQADLYILDEPFAGVDMASEQAIMNVLRKLTAQGKSVLVVHHDLKAAEEYFDWLVLLNQRVVASGPTQDVFTAELLSSTYGGKLDLLVQVADRLQLTGLPRREKNVR